MARKISDDTRASLAFIEALHRTEDMDFSRDDIIISEKKKMGDPVVCTVEARRGNGVASHAKGKAFIYPDMIIVCVESVWKKLSDPIHPHHYEYLSY
ncbi:MAG: hypothetical protein ACLP9S_18505 [Syntrophales bacterium]